MEDNILNEIGNNVDEQLKSNIIAQDPRVKLLIKQILEKIERKKKYKNDSKDMLLELKTMLTDIYESINKNNQNSEKGNEGINTIEEKK